MGLNEFEGGVEVHKYEIGQVIDNFKHHQECVKFDISDDGATMFVFFQSPTEQEIEQFKSGKNFELRFTELYKVIMLTVKIGNLNWMDAPYSPHLSRQLTKFQLPGEGQGVVLTLMLIDAITGEIKHIRLLGLSERFTKQLFRIVMEQKSSNFDLIEYNKSLNKIYSTYSTNQIVKMSRDYCKINS